MCFVLVAPASTREMANLQYVHCSCTMCHVKYYDLIWFPNCFIWTCTVVLPVNSRKFKLLGTHQGCFRCKTYSCINCNYSFHSLIDIYKMLCMPRLLRISYIMFRLHVIMKSTFILLCCYLGDYVCQRELRTPWKGILKAEAHYFEQEYRKQNSQTLM